MTTEIASAAGLLADRDPEARRRGVQRLGELGGSVAIEWLARALADEDWRVRKEAAAAAPSLTPRAEVLGCLFRALGDRDRVGLRNAAVEALVLIGSDAVDVAVRALALLDADGRKLAVEVLAGAPGLPGTRALVRALTDEDVNVRATAAEALGTAGLSGVEARAIAVAALTEVLQIDEPLRCLSALDSLIRLDAKLPWSVLAPLTRDPILRRPAIAAAGRTREPAALLALTRTLGHGPEVPHAASRDALVAVATCLTTEATGSDLVRLVRTELQEGRGARDRVHALATTEEDPEARRAALALLGLFAVEADVSVLVGSLSDRDVSDGAELGLCWFGERALPALLREGALATPQVRAVTLSFVPRLTDRPDATTLGALRGALTADAVPVVVAAIVALGVVGGSADLPNLAGHVSAPDARVSATASAALTRIATRHPDEARASTPTLSAGPDGTLVGCLLRLATAGHADASRHESADLAFLRAALDHDEVRVRRAAVDALAAIGGPTSAEVVARALADEERDVVLAAIRALGTMKETDPLLAVLEDARDATVVAAALRALAEANPPRGFEAAWALLRSEDPQVASSAIETIGPSRGARRDEALFFALGHADAGVVKAALSLLARELSPRTLAHVGACLDSDSYEVRRFSAELLGGADDPSAHALIRARLDRETDPVVRQALVHSLTSRRPGGEAA